MKKWKIFAEIIHDLLGKPQDLHPFVEDRMDIWLRKTQIALESGQHLPSRCKALRQAALATIAQKVADGLPYVPFEEAPTGNGNWVGSVTPEGLGAKTYRSKVTAEGEVYAEPDNTELLQDLSTDCLCLIADNLYL